MTYITPRALVPDVKPLAGALDVIGGKVGGVWRDRRLREWGGHEQALPEPPAGGGRAARHDAEKPSSGRAHIIGTLGVTSRRSQCMEGLGEVRTLEGNEGHEWGNGRKGRFGAVVGRGDEGVSGGALGGGLWGGLRRGLVWSLSGVIRTGR